MLAPVATPALPQLDLGLGVAVSASGRLVITTVVPSSPAALVGGQDGDEVVAINHTANYLAFVEDTEITVHSVRMPNNATLIDNLRPRIAVAECKLNPAQLALNRQTYKDKLYRELHAYHIFKDNPLAEKSLGLTEEQNVQLMVL